jgi:hypothetical protein
VRDRGVVVEQCIEPDIGDKSSKGISMPQASLFFGREMHRSLSGSVRNSNTCFWR